jgi:hypothetical protein
MLAAAVTELLELETASGRLLVLGRRVVPLLALSALQCHNFPHFKSFAQQFSIFNQPRRNISPEGRSARRGQRLLRNF